MNILASYWRASRLLLLIGAMAVAGGGFLRAATRLAAETIDLLLDPGMDMTTLVGS